MTESNLQRNQDLNLHSQERGITAANQNPAVARIVNIVYFLFGALELLLVLRLILYLLGTNADNSFANFINGLSGPFVTLFTNLLRNPALTTTAGMATTTIITMLACAVAAWLSVRLLWLAFGRRP